MDPMNGMLKNFLDAPLKYLNLKKLNLGFRKNKTIFFNDLR